MLKAYQKTLSFILAIIMLTGMFAAFPVFAENEDTVSTFDDLKAALENEEGRNVTLGGNIAFTTEEFPLYMITVAGTHTIDLNGHTLTAVNAANLNGNYEDSTLFFISEGASLTVCDSSDEKEGVISYCGGIEPIPNGEGSEVFEKVSSRNLFTVANGGSLYVINGKYVAGNEKTQWLNNALSISNEKYEYTNTFATQVVCGTVATVLEGGKLTVYNGEFISNGRSRSNTLPNLKGWDEERPASTCINGEGGSEVTVYDGVFVGDNGSNVFHFVTSTKASIRSGSFTTLPVTNERAVDREGYAAYIRGDYCGSVGLPMYFVPHASRSCVYLDNERLDAFSSSTVLKSSNGKTYYIRPETTDGAKVTASGIVSSYSIGSKAYLKAAYNRYFSEDSTITYRWYVIMPDGSKTDLTGATSDTVDLSKLSSMNCQLSVGNKYTFGCIVTENHVGSQDYTLTTACATYELTTSNRNIIASVSLTPSKINDKNLYYAGTAPTFSVKSDASYTIVSVNWFDINKEESLGSSPKFVENTRYRIAVELKAKGAYRFSTDSRVSFLPGADAISIIPSEDGTTATVYGWVNTECSHSLTTYVIEEKRHSKICNTCGEVFSTDQHSYGDWIIENGNLTSGKHTCGVCGHTEAFTSSITESDGIKTVSSFTLDYTRVYYTNLTVNKIPSLPYPTEAELISIDSYTWKDNNDSDFESFEFNKEYTLTLNVSLIDKEHTVFADPLTVNTVFPDKISVTVSEDKTSAVIVIKVVVLEELYSRITLPQASVGNTISTTMPDTKIDGIKITWTRDGKKIGSYVIRNGKATNVTDADPDDGIDFNTAKFEYGHTYLLIFEWDVLDKGLVIYEGGHFVFVAIATASEYRFVYGVQGFISAVYRMNPSGTLCRTPAVNEIVTPVAGSAPKTSGKSANSIYSVSSVVWKDKNGNSVSKFLCGETYTVTVTLTMKNGYTFATGTYTASINGVKCDATVTSTKAILTATFTTSHVYNYKKPTVTLPDCSNNGSVTVKCEHCESNVAVELIKTGHRAYTVNGIDPTCKNEGMKAHVKCYDCDIIISDVEGNATTLDALKLNKTEHVEFEALCYDMTNHFHCCVSCGEVISEAEMHSLSNVTLTDGTQYAICDCGYFYLGIVPTVPSGPSDGSEEELGLSGMPIDKIKSLLIVAIILLVLILIAIIAIGIYLIVTRNSYRSLMIEAGVITVEEVTSKQDNN